MSENADAVYHGIQREKGGSVTQSSLFEFIERQCPSCAGSLLRHLQSRMTTFSGRHQESSVSLVEFEDMIRLVYENTLVATLTEIRKQADKVEERLKESYRKGRRNYEKFIDSYLEFNKRLGRSLNVERQNVYFKELPEL